LPPENRSVLEVSKENGIATQTIYTWLKQAKDGTLEGSTDRMRPCDRGIGKKFTLLLEGKSVKAEEHGEWLIPERRTAQVNTSGLTGTLATDISYLLPIMVNSV
jgi:transposase-like protein